MKDSTRPDDPLAALERFIVENDDLLNLESNLRKFNIFDALKISRHEIRHSDFLAFLLDPAESHGQGALFLKALLMDMLKSAPVELRPLSPIELDGADLRGVKIQREWAHIDLLITCQNPHFIVVVENKVDSLEHSDQLTRYRATINRHHPGARPLYVFLTANSDEASDDQWTPYGYADIFRVFSRVRTTFQNAIGADVLVFLDHYLSLIGTRFMNDATIDDLCKRIYKNHRQALELIMERVGGPTGDLMEEIERILNEDPRWKVMWKGGKYIDFLPTSWLEWLPPFSTEYTEAQAWIVFRLHLRVSQLRFYIQINQMEDMAVRRSIIDVLAANADKLGFVRKGARGVTDKHTRVSSSERLVDWEDDEPDMEKIRAAVIAKLDALFPKLKKAREILRDVLKLPA